MTKGEEGVFPERDERLGRALAEATSPRTRSAEEWASLRSRIVAAAEVPLARRRRVGWWAPLAERAPALTAAAAVVLLILGGMVYLTPRVDPAFADVSAEFAELLGEEEMHDYFPGVDDPERLLEAALALR
jgi:anti-sigma-K factor RskA